ncbi:copper resistance-associated p-type atpase [Colletotrichum chrysophilum]|uniref:Copper resistance-associated p-type atpase n=2 Tax=Colletotrichum chrysophilum TaxID=1836956 RepID=A0AAD9EJZ9_9PEZI|nr:copper resistance-associated p-type atpase [Colletotrichum chrysophilum]
MVSKMARRSAAVQETTFLVPNIHCPTCTGFIEPLLRELTPSPKSIITSIINHSVTVEHDKALSPKKVSRVLADAGYDVDSIIIGPQVQEPGSGRVAQPPNANAVVSVSLLRRLYEALDCVGRQINEEEKQRRHAEHCMQCREEKLEGDGQAISGVAIGNDQSLKLHRAIISIDGMTCSSCVGNVTNALEAQTWVQSVNVGLITRAATIEFFDENNTNELVNTIESLGYDPTLERVEEVAGSSTDNLWQASLSIMGMTCSSCVGTVTGALEKLPYTESVNVNLVTSSGVVNFHDKSHLNNIVSTIEDLGYEATLNNLIEVNSDRLKDSHRVLSIKVTGMYCAHCPGRVLAAFSPFGDRLSVQDHGTLENPIFTVTYVPQVPDFTVRAILESIMATDDAFVPTVYHPPTMEERSQQMMRRTRLGLMHRVLLCFVAAIPTLIIGIVYMNLVSPENHERHYLMQPLSGVSRAEWSLLIMATPVYVFAADIFHRRAIKELYSLWRPGSPVPILRRLYRFGSMDMLVSFATTIAYFSSIAEIIIAATNNHHVEMQSRPSHMDAVVFLALFLLVGRMIEAYSKAKTGEAVSKLGSLRPKEALLLVNEQNGNSQVKTIGVDLLDCGDRVRVVHGGSPPWDGVLIDGSNAEFVESSLTGESKPVEKQLGDPIYSGTVNNGGPITMQITGASGDSLLDQIIKVVREGQARRAPIERVADSITGYFVPVVTLIAITTWVTWLGLGLSGRLPQDYEDVAVGGWPFWSLQFAIAVFVVACPCGIGLAAPTALFVGGGLAAKHGILAKGGGEAFQEASNLDIIVFDKTGTLTEGGEPTLTDHRILAIDDAQKGAWDENIILGCLAELESNSSHPIAKAITTFCGSQCQNSFKSTSITEVPGKGIKGTFTSASFSASFEIIVGNEALMADHGASFDEQTLEELDSWKSQAKSVVLAAGKLVSSDDSVGWNPLAIFAVSDAIRPEVKPVLDALREQGIDVWMLSGDNAKTARAVGAMVGIPEDRIIAGVLPEQKAEKIEYLQKSQIKIESFLGIGNSRYRRPTVAMVGDGINDSPALTVADVGIAIGSGSDVAISAADFVLINSSLTTLLTLTSLSRAVFRRVKFNFAWALVYNLVALPIAAGVLYPIKTNGSHTRLDPVWAALAMALSSLSVITSSLLLRLPLPVVGYKTKTIGNL